MIKGDKVIGKLVEWNLPYFDDIFPQPSTVTLVFDKDKILLFN